MLMSAVDVVVVEDGDTLREELRLFLVNQGYEVRACANGFELDEQFATRVADLVILDLNLPHEDGLSIAERLRQRWPTIGIIMLTARDAPPQRTEGYSVGADVYLTKPTNLAELSAAMSNLSRRLERQHTMGWCLDLRQSIVRGPHGSARLTTLELDILRELAMAPQRELNTARLLECIQRTRTENCSRNSLTIGVSRLRTKMVEQLNAPDCLKAVRSHGYRLTVAMAVIG